MTTVDDLEGLLDRWMAETAPTSMPLDLHEATIGRARVTRQRRGGLGSRRNWSPEAATRLRVLALVAVVAVVGAIAWSLAPGAKRQPTPTTRPADSIIRDDRFFLPFAYSIPVDSGLRQESLPNAPDDIVSWVVLSGPPSLTEIPQKGVVMMTIGSAWMHTTAGRRYIGTTPEAVFASLRDEGRLAIGEPTAATLDGRPGLTAATLQRGPTGDHIHVSAPIGGLVGQDDEISLDRPYRLIVAEIDGTPVMVQVWDLDYFDMDEWVPVAMQLVDSIHFDAR